MLKLLEKVCVRLGTVIIPLAAITAVVWVGSVTACRYMESRAAAQPPGWAPSGAPAPFTPPPILRQPVGPQPTPALQPGTEAPQHRLTFRERRRLGLTFRNVHRILSEMQAEGELEGKDNAVLAIEVMERLIGENPQEWSDVPGDWQDFFETVIAFLEKIIPLIIKIIALFSQVMPLDAGGLCQATPVAVPFYPLPA